MGRNCEVRPAKHREAAKLWNKTNHVLHIWQKMMPNQFTEEEHTNKLIQKAINQEADCLGDMETPLVVTHNANASQTMPDFECIVG